MLGEATIEEKYKENMKDTLFIVSKCSENLAFKNQLFAFGSRWGKEVLEPFEARSG